MSDDKNVQAQPVKEAEVTPAVAPKDETKASEIYEKKEAKVVPEAKFLEYKKENKELKKEIAEIKRMMTEGATKAEVDNEIESLAKEHNIDTNFLKKLSSTIEKDLSTKFSKEEPKKKDNSDDEEETKVVDIDKSFNEHYERVIQHLPDFDGIVNKEIIKSLALNPKNGHKTLTEIIEETYGAVLKGKKTIDATKPGGGKDPQPLDMKRAQTDAEYRRNVVFADPDLKRQYNAQMLTRGL